MTMSKTVDSIPDAQIPAHVPPELVRRWPLSPSAPLADPYEEIIPAIHRGPDVFYASDGVVCGGWVFRKASVVREILCNPEIFSSRQCLGIAGLIGEDWPLIPTEIDPPQHQFYRVLMNPAFAPKSIRTIESQVRDVARGFTTKMFGAKTEGDFVKEFTQRFPIAVFLSMIDFPFDQVDTYLGYVYDIMANPDLAAKQKSATAVRDIFLAVIDERTKTPGEDLVSFMIGAEFEGRRMTPTETLGAAYLFFLGGLDTVTSSLGWIFRYLATHPDQQQELRANPSLIPAATEELLRAFAMVTTQRRVTREIDFHGVRLMPDDMVLVSPALACRDPEFCERPEIVDFHRGPVRHLTFGTGPHFCIGLHLAKREIIVALEEVLSATQRFWIKDGGQVRWHLGGVLGLDALELQWES